MFKIFKKKEEKKKEKRYVSVMFDESEAGSRIMLLTEVRGRISAMPNECNRDKVLMQIDEELVSLVDRFGNNEYVDMDKNDYYKMVDAAVKKNLAL